MNCQKSKVSKNTRRHFIKVTGTIVLVAGTRWNLFASEEIPPSDGYLLVDMEKCIGSGACYKHARTLREERLSHRIKTITANSRVENATSVPMLRFIGMMAVEVRMGNRPVWKYAL
jgi:hypothetical protein